MLLDYILLVDVLAVGVVVPTGCRIVVVELCLVLGGAWCLVLGAGAAPSVLKSSSPDIRLALGWRS